MGNEVIDFNLLHHGERAGRGISSRGGLRAAGLERNHDKHYECWRLYRNRTDWNLKTFLEIKLLPAYKLPFSETA